MDTKFIFVTGGVVSGLGKGITAASLGRLLKARGYKVTMQKLDPYLNVDPGTLSPYQHGEVFVTFDGAETDLDLGHYERFIDENLNKYSNVTSGRIFDAVMNDERQGLYDGSTLQMIPHVTNKIKEHIRLAAEAAGADIAIVEIGGTVGDIESLPFIEAIRQFASQVGRDSCVYVHVTLLPTLSAVKEVKTKPTQHSVRTLLGLGIQADVVVCRVSEPMPEEAREKIASLCNLSPQSVVQNLDLPVLYSVPLSLEKEGLCRRVLELLNLPQREPDLADWIAMTKAAEMPGTPVRIALVGKYVALHDAYLSVVEALKHGAITGGGSLEIVWVNSEELTAGNCAQAFAGVHGIIVPGGFGGRGVEGMIAAARYARENDVPYFGICLGMQIAMIEFCRNVLGLDGAHSTEFDPQTKHPIICFLPGQNETIARGGTLRLGNYPCRLLPGSKAASIYNAELIYERHRHRYEVNNDYLQRLSSSGMRACGTSPDGSIVEMIEIPEHSWFVGCQFHPEFNSRPNRPQPLFKSFVAAAIQKARQA